MSSVSVWVRVDVGAAIKSGKTSYPEAKITISDANLASISEADRLILGSAISSGAGRAVKEARDSDLMVTGPTDSGSFYGILTVKDPSFAGIVSALKEQLAEKLAQKAERDAHKEQEQKRIFNSWVADFPQFSSNGRPEKFSIFSPYNLDMKRPEVVEFVASERYLDAVKEAERLTQAALANHERDIEQQKIDAEAKKAAEVTELGNLRAWVEQNGSDLARRQLAKGFPGWVANAREERRKAAEDYVKACVVHLLERIPGWVWAGDYADYSFDGYEPLRSPSLNELDALEAVQLRFPDADLVRSKYEADETEDDSDDPEIIHRNEIRIPVKTDNGIHHGYICSKDA